VRDAACKMHHVLQAVVETANAMCKRKCKRIDRLSHVWLSSVHLAKDYYIALAETHQAAVVSTTTTVCILQRDKKPSPSAATLALHAGS
jgi:hypothetical protein